MEAFSHTSPSVKKWTKNTVGTLITVGGLGSTPVGTPSQVADELERWVDEADVDGFNFVSLSPLEFFPRIDSAIICPPRSFLHEFFWTHFFLHQAYALFPSSFQDIAELLLPELRARELFWSDYAVPNGTYRENFYARKGQTGPLDEHVAAGYRWKAGVEKSEHVIPNNSAAA